MAPLSPEEERVVRQRTREALGVIGPALDEILEGIENGTIPIESEAGAAAQTRSILGNYSNDLEVVFRNIAADGTEVGRTLAVERFGVDVFFEDPPIRVIEQLDQWLVRASNEFLDGISGDMGSFLNMVHEEGLGIPDAVDMLRDEFWEERIEEWRVEHAVRTEVNASANAGSHSAYEEASTVIGEQWLSTLDGRARPEHEAMHRVAVAVDLLFELPGGATAMYPGDPSLPLDQRINCRCRPVPLFQDQVTSSELVQLQSGNQIQL